MRGQSEGVSVGDLTATDRDVLIAVARLQELEEPPEPQDVYRQIGQSRDLTEQSVYNSLDNLTTDYGCLEGLENNSNDKRKEYRYRLTDRGGHVLKELFDQLKEISHVLSNSVGCCSGVDRRSNGEQKQPKTDGGIEIKPSSAVHARSVAKNLYAVLANHHQHEESLYKLSRDEQVAATREQIERAVKLYPSQFSIRFKTTGRQSNRKVATVRLTEQARSGAEPNWRVRL